MKNLTDYRKTVKTGMDPRPIRPLRSLRGQHVQRRLQMSVAFSELKPRKKILFIWLSMSSTKVLIGDTIFTSPTGDGTAILRGHPSHAKV